MTFVLTQENAFPRGFMLKPTERPFVPLEIFKMFTRLKKGHVFV